MHPGIRRTGTTSWPAALIRCSNSQPYLYMGAALRRAAPPTISHRLSLESTIHPLCRILRRPCVLFSGLFESRQPSSVFFLQSIYQPLPACASACASASTMSTAMRLGSSALRTSLRAPAFSAGTTSFQAIRCYSAKTQVCRRHWELPGSSGSPRLARDEQSGLGRSYLVYLANPSSSCQTLKERFAELLPEKIEEIKTLRKSVTTNPPVRPHFVLN